MACPQQQRILRLLCVCLAACALLGVTFGQEHDFREEPKQVTSSTSTRNLPYNDQSLLPCLTPMSFLDAQGISNTFMNPQSITAADFDNDGNNDVAVAYAGSNAVVVYYRRGSNWDARNIGDVPGASAVFAVDLNGDGLVDLIAAGQGNNTVYWFKNTPSVPSGWFQYVVGSATSPQSVFAADINGDLRLDIIVGGGIMKWFENEIDNVAPSSWTGIPITINATTAFDVNSVSAADINNDGFIDIVIASSSQNEVAWLNNTGNGSAFTMNKIAAPSAPAQVFVTDIDQDGWQDVMTVNPGSNTTTLYYNNMGNNHTIPAGDNVSAPTSSAQWTGVYVATNQNRPQSLFVANLDGPSATSAQYIVVANTNANEIYYYNTTNKYVWFGTLAANFTGPTSIFVRDLTGDGTADIIAASSNTDAVVWFQDSCAVYHQSSSDQHIVGWVVAPVVIGSLLIMWLLVAIAIGIHDYIAYLAKKSKKKLTLHEVEAMVPPEVPPL